MLKKYLAPLFFLTPCIIWSQSPLVFEDASEKYLGDSRSFSALSLGFTDINSDFRDDLITLHEGNIAYAAVYQGLNQKMSVSNGRNKLAGQPEWSFSVGDLDGDGISEILATGAYNNLKILKFNNSLNRWDLSQNPQTQAFGQGCNVVDFDLDGDLDFFLSNDDGPSRFFKNEDAGNLVYGDPLIDFSTDPVTDQSGNYGSEWIDLNHDGHLELFLAKCSRNADLPTDPRRINQLYQLNEDGVYLDIASKVGVDDGAQSWSSVFEDLDNDGDFDLILVNHQEPHSIYENKEGTFEKKELPFRESLFSFQVIGGDLNNDGFIDLYFMGQEDLLLLNKGNFTFEFYYRPLSPFVVHSAAFGDLNSDGRLDVFASYGKPIVEKGERADKLWINKNEENNFLKVSLLGEVNNKAGIGCNILLYGDWGVQTRAIRGGQGYSIVNSHISHFGLGQHNSYDSIAVIWPGGFRQMIPGSEEINTHLLIKETSNIPTFVSLRDSVILLCADESVALNLEDNFVSYLWNNGETTESIETDIPGTYYCSVTDDLGQEHISQVYFVMLDDRSDEEILDLSMTIDCSFAEISIGNPETTNIVWSDGSDGLSIEVSNSQTVSVHAKSSCGEDITDVVPVELVDFLNELPVDTIKEFQNKWITSPYKTTYWYNSSEDTEPFLIGDSLYIENATNNETFYLEFEDTLAGESIFLKTLEDTTLLNYGNPAESVSMFFDVYEEIVLDSLEVFTDRVGPRNFLIIEGGGDTIYNQIIECSSGFNRIKLGAYLTPGLNYQLNTDARLNQEILGQAGPRFKSLFDRLFFPYKSDGLLSIIGNPNRPGFYYFFNWVVKRADLFCISDRTPKKIVIDKSNSLNENKERFYNISPNPVQDKLLHNIPMGSDVRIHNALGNQVMNQKVTSTTLDFSDLHPGFYTMIINDKHRLSTYKFLKL